jgi:hypothetical protein
MKISKLLPEEAVKSAFIYGSLENLYGRCTGKSLGRNLVAIGELLLNPMTTMLIDCKNHKAARFKIQGLEYVIQTMDLKYIQLELKGSRIILYYDVLTEVDAAGNKL